MHSVLVRYMYQKLDHHSVVGVHGQLSNLIASVAFQTNSIRYEHLTHGYFLLTHHDISNKMPRKDGYFPFWFSMNIPLPPDPDCCDTDDPSDQSHKDTQPMNGNQEEYANLS